MHPCKQPIVIVFQIFGLSKKENHNDEKKNYNKHVGVGSSTNAINDLPMSMALTESMNRGSFTSLQLLLWTEAARHGQCDDSSGGTQHASLLSKIRNAERVQHQGHQVVA